MDSGTITPECEAACGDASNPTQTLYRFHAFDLSYFSAKVRPALSYPDLSHEELRPDLGGMRQHIGLTFIPILLTPGGETGQDSKEILNWLKARNPAAAHRRAADRALRRRVRARARDAQARGQARARRRASRALSP